jgi:hypothetical protein
MVGVDWFLGFLGEDGQLLRNAAFIQCLVWSVIADKFLDLLGRYTPLILFRNCNPDSRGPTT